MLLVDTKLGSVIKDEELKQKIASRRSFGEWLDHSLLSLEDLHQAHKATKRLAPSDHLWIRKSEEDVPVEKDRHLPMFGYSAEDLSLLLVPTIRDK